MDKLTLFNISLFMFGAIQAGLLYFIVGGLFGRFGPGWSQRCGNFIVVISITALLIKMEAPEGYVGYKWLDEFNLILGILGAFWCGIGDLLCRAARKGQSLKEIFHEAINK